MNKTANYKVINTRGVYCQRCGYAFYRTVEHLK